MSVLGSEVVNLVEVFDGDMDVPITSNDIATTADCTDTVNGNPGSSPQNDIVDDSNAIDTVPASGPVLKKMKMDEGKFTHVIFLHTLSLLCDVFRIIVLFLLSCCQCV